MNTTHEAVKNQPEYGIAYRKHYKHLRSLSGQMNITTEGLKRDIANMENIILELLPWPASKIADVSGALDAYTEELERREFADKAPSIEEMTPPPIQVAVLEEGQTFDELLAKYNVSPPGTWGNERWTDDWWVVTNASGIVAYFSNETYAIAFRSWLVMAEMGHHE